MSIKKFALYLVALSALGAFLAGAVAAFKEYVSTEQLAALQKRLNRTRGEDA